MLIQLIRDEAEPTVAELVGLLRRGFVLGASGEWDEIVLEAYEVFSKDG